MSICPNPPPKISKIGIEKNDEFWQELANMKNQTLTIIKALDVSFMSPSPSR